MFLDEFNASDAAEAASVVAVWAAIPAWVDAIVRARPFDSVDALAAHAAAAAAQWTPADLDAALAHHPRIGQRPAGAGAEAAASRREQAAMTDAATDVTLAIAAGNAEYEDRFGRVFIVRAAGRSGTDILEHLQQRLDNSDELERAATIDQLTQIAVLRMKEALS